MDLPIIIASIIFPLIISGGAYLIISTNKKANKIKKKLTAQEKQLKREAYESEILRELGERFGYELNEEKIVDIITGSIGKLFSFSTVSSLLIQPENIIFKAHLEESVSQSFITSVKKNMLASLQALSEKNLDNSQIVEESTGTVLDENNKNRIGSYFNIPIVINEKLTGLLNISSTKPGLYQEGEMIILYKIVTQASSAVTKLRHVLETEKGKLSSMVSSMSEGVIMVDRDTRLQIINPTAKKFLNISQEEPSFLSIIDALKDKFDVSKSLQDSVDNNKLVIIDDIQFDEAIAQVLISPVKDKNNQMIGTVMVLHDISQEKELEHLRDEFTAMLVHELRAPLTAVRGASSSLLSHLDQFSKEKKIEYLNMIESSSKNMIAIVSDLLDAAKIEAGKFQINQQPTDIVKVINQKIEEAKPLVEEKKLTITQNLTQEPIQLNIDSLRIGQVLMNFLSNAIKYTDKGLIEVNLSKEEKKVIISIKDTGIGISEEGQKKLFSKFAQLTSKGPRTIKGTGLGLTISKGIVESHGGKVWLTSELNKGSTFFFSLPI